MKTRLINAAVFLALYLAFLAWYDGWGMDPFAGEAVGFGESVRSQQDCNSVFSLTRLQEGYDAMTSASAPDSPCLNAFTG